MGAPGKLTKELIARICASLRAGAYVETAAAYAGVHKATFYAWLKKGATAKEGLEKDLSDAVEQAQAEAEVRDLLNIDAAALGLPAEYDSNRNVLREEQRPSWQASAWRLERKFPKKWGRQERMELTGLDGEAIKFEETRKDLRSVLKDKEAFGALLLIAGKLDPSNEKG